MEAGHADQHQDCRGCIPDIMAVFRFFYSTRVEKAGLRRMAEGGRLMKGAIGSDACQRCLSRSSSSSFSTLHRLCPMAPCSHNASLRQAY